MVTVFRTVMVVALMGLPGLPARADIVLDHSAEACTREFSDGRVTLTETEVKFWESSCEITGQTEAGNGARNVTMLCSGEGEVWENALRIEETATGYRLTGDGGPVDFVRCN